MPQYYPIQSRVPSTTIDPVQAWVWGKLAGGFVYQATQTLGGKQINMNHGPREQSQISENKYTLNL